MGNHNSSDGEELFHDRDNKARCQQFYVDAFQSLVLEYLELEQRSVTEAHRYRDLYGRIADVVERLPEFCGTTDQLPYYRFMEHVRWKIQSLSTETSPPGVLPMPMYQGQRFEDSVMVFAGHHLAASPAAPALDVVRRTPVIPPRLVLSQQMDLMLPHVRPWLLQLGRSPEYGQMMTKAGDFTGQDYPLALGGTMSRRKDPGDRFVLGNRFELSGREVNELRDAARYSVAVVSMDPPVGPDGYYIPTREDSEDYVREQRRMRSDDQEARDSTMVGVTGPVYVMFDNDFEPQAKGGLPITTVSVAGMSFQKGRAEERRFVEITDKGERRIRHDQVDFLLGQLHAMLHHIFLRYQQFRCEVPVLCAIGCGVFAAGVQDIPTYYARTIARLLSRHQYGFSAVVVALVTPADFAAFRTAFADAGEGQLRTTVILTLHRSMIHIADRLARANVRAGMLNPSDAVSVRCGYIGYQFDGGHAALEEILALQTTMLLQHRGADPTLYTDASRFTPERPRCQRADGPGPRYGVRRGRLTNPRESAPLWWCRLQYKKKDPPFGMTVGEKWKTLRESVLKHRVRYAVAGGVLAVIVAHGVLCGGTAPRVRSWCGGWYGVEGRRRRR